MKFRKSKMLLKSVDRLSTIDGTITAVGWCEGNEIPLLVVNGRKVEKQLGILFDRPDVAKVHSGIKASGFRVVAVMEAAPDDNSRVELRFSDGTLIRRTSASEQETEVQSILEEFKRMVSAAPSASMIEIGSRARSGNTYRGLFPTLSRYTGIDITDGPNVDLVGDAHRLSEFVEERFDFAFSVSVFEHLIMPWVASFELNKVLRDGAIAYVQSHPTWPLHEEPWDFFRFSKDAWSGLFNRFTGFEVLRAGYGIGANIVSIECESGPLQWLDRERTYLLSACLVRKIGDATVDWSANPAALYNLNYSH